MTANQLPGEVTFDDVRARLAAAIGHIIAAEATHDEVAAAVDEARSSRVPDPVPPPTDE